MNFHVDRDLPVPIRVQLKGLIEYGIACGELAAGEALPSVRELAERIGVAPMTVSQVYGELKAAGLIEARAGAGTFVATTSPARAPRPATARLRRRIDELIDEGLASGVRASDLAALVSARLAHRMSLGRRVSVAMVGIFPEATATYARAIAAQLGNAVTVTPLTIAAIERDAAARSRAASADLAVTFVNRQREVAALLPTARVVSISFIPSEETRRSLASLDPRVRLAVVSRFPEFLPVMRAGVGRFAPHVARIAAATLGTEGAAAAVADAEVVVYATGAEAVLDGLPADVDAFEYRHIPDPGEVERILVPAVRPTESLKEPEPS
jgi:DNA-binding transcriptional regulator YhcF (GntR family)